MANTLTQDPSFAKGYLRQAAALSGLGRNGEALACLEAGLLSAEPKEDVSQLHAASADVSRYDGYASCLLENNRETRNKSSDGLFGCR